MRRMIVIVGVTLCVTACQAQPPTPPAPRDATPVAASFDATWDATIDHFAENNIPIATIERASGIIATTELRVDPELAEESSDCGTGQGISVDMRFHATTAVYNILVRGDDRSSTVRATVSWVNPAANFECVTTGVWETETEEAIRVRAEG